MSEKIEGKWAGEFIVSEAQGTRSREAITILSGAGVLEPGTVLGKVAVGAATAAAKDGNSGAGTMGAVTVGAGAKAGVYKVVFIEPASGAGVFMVTDPAGINLGTGNVGAAFSAGGIGFTIADGTPDFASGDGFDITVAPGSGKYVAWANDGTDGRENAVGVLYDRVDATDADADGVGFVRDCEIAKNALSWAGTPDDNAKASAYAGLATLGVIAR